MTEFKLQMVHLLAKGTHNMSQISRDYHVTRSLLYAWIRLYQERGEAAFVPDRAIDCPPEVERPQSAEERVAFLERLCGQQALELDVLRSEVNVLKRAWHQLPPVP
jgi:transposase-like protein